ncbi:MAG: hypothetical protein ACYTKD_16160 [Planctomycetota bacterium]|jgi:hypothetical protein
MARNPGRYGETHLPGCTAALRTIRFSQENNFAPGRASPVLHRRSLDAIAMDRVENAPDPAPSSGLPVPAIRSFGSKVLQASGPTGLYHRHAYAAASPLAPSAPGEYVPLGAAAPGCPRRAE